jgi:hypothetical protein
MRRGLRLENHKETSHQEWEDNIKMDFIELRWGGTDLIPQAQEMKKWTALVNTGMNISVS